MIVSYTRAKECNNDECLSFICYKCGKCGRQFNEDGFMIDEGGTHPIPPTEE